MSGRRTRTLRLGRSAPEDPDATDPAVDLSAVRADEDLLETLRTGRAVPAGSGGAEGLPEMLAAWRTEIESAPMPELVSVDEAFAALEAGRREGAHRATASGEGPSVRRLPAPRRLPVSVAAAAALLAVLGFSAAVHQAQPGQALWGVNQVVFSSHAAAVQREHDARSTMAQADDALRHNDYSTARTLLHDADPQIGAVRGEDRAPLLHERDRLTQSLAPTASSGPVPASRTPGGTSTGAPSASSVPASPSSAPTSTSTPAASSPAHAGTASPAGAATHAPAAGSTG